MIFTNNTSIKKPLKKNWFPLEKFQQFYWWFSVPYLHFISKCQTTLWPHCYVWCWNRIDFHIALVLAENKCMEWNFCYDCFWSGLYNFHFRNCWYYVFFGVEAFFLNYLKFPLTVFITTIVWIGITFLTKPESDETLINFYKKIIPGGPGWKYYLRLMGIEKLDSINLDKKWNVSTGILAMLLGCLLMYSIIYTTGNWIYGNIKIAIAISVLSLVTMYLLLKIWEKRRNNFL